jgi:hypothetical protein
MSFQPKAAESCVPGWGPRAPTKLGIRHYSTIYNVFPVSLS